MDGAGKSCAGGTRDTGTIHSTTSLEGHEFDMAMATDTILLLQHISLYDDHNNNHTSVITKTRTCATT